MGGEVAEDAAAVGMGTEGALCRGVGSVGEAGGDGRRW